MVTREYQYFFLIPAAALAIAAGICTFLVPHSVSNIIGYTALGIGASPILSYITGPISKKWNKDQLQEEEAETEVEAEK